MHSSENECWMLPVTRMDSQKGSANFTIQLPQDYINSTASKQLQAIQSDGSELLHKDSSVSDALLLTDCHTINSSTPNSYIRLLLPRGACTRGLNSLPNSQPSLWTRLPRFTSIQWVLNAIEGRVADWSPYTMGVILVFTHLIYCH